MADLRRTISETSSEPDVAPIKKWDVKADWKQKDDEEEDVIQMDTRFSLVDDNLKKDVSKILKWKEYHLTANSTGNKWNFSKSVTED